MALRRFHGHSVISTLILEVREEDQLLGEHKQAQPSASKRLVIHRPRVGHDLFAFINHDSDEASLGPVNEMPPIGCVVFPTDLLGVVP